MRVLITGAAGVLGQNVIGRLERDPRYELKLTDALPLETAHEFVQADLSDPEQALGVCEGVQQVMHIAAIHPWKTYTPQQYLDLNIKGTHNLLAEAARAKVDRVIYTSSVAAMGYDVSEDTPLPWDETRPCRPYDSIYSVSKHVGEQFCHLFRQTAGLPFLALRPGGFAPRSEDDPAYGLNLLGIGVHRDDVAQAHVLALGTEIVDEAIIVAAGTTFTRADAATLRGNAAEAILRDFPQAQALVDAGVTLPDRLSQCYDISKARRLLGFEPEWTFGSWLERWSAGR